jgi:tRNA dimethylallyltransferase
MFSKLPKRLYIILGPTASGKTELACSLAKKINGEIISADSRQVYQGMDIGTGKDIDEYKLGDIQIPYHLIDIKSPLEDFNLFEFQKEFYKALNDIWHREKNAILCGGSGMYLDSAISPFELLEVPYNTKLRKELESKNLKELGAILTEEKEKLHNDTDTLDRERAIRAIEIAKYEKINNKRKSIVEDYIVFGIKMDREKLRERIAIRLDSRLENGMIEEVKGLVNQGVSYERLKYFGLEYSFISRYLQNEISFTEMREKLLQAIRRFAKKQMTWYRRMEKNGTQINWIDAELSLEEKIELIMDISNGKVSSI